MNGAEKIFIYGEQIARFKDLDAVYGNIESAKDEAMMTSNAYANMLFNSVPVIDIPSLVLNGFNYTYEDPDAVETVQHSVEAIDTVQPFVLNSSGYYESTNHDDESFSMCKLNLINNSDTSQFINLEVIQSSEKDFDFGLVSMLDCVLNMDSGEDDVNVHTNYRGIEGQTNTLIEIPTGTHFMTIKYIKDSSASSGQDTFQFKVSGTNTITEVRHLDTVEDRNKKLQNYYSKSEADSKIDEKIGNNLFKTFEGTEDDYNNMSDVEKSKYQLFILERSETNVPLSGEDIQALNDTIGVIEDVESDLTEAEAIEQTNSIIEGDE